MGDETRFAILIGRLVELLRSPSASPDDQKAALRAISDVTARRSLTLRKEGANLYVEGVTITPETPFVGLLAQQLSTHGIVAITTSYAAPAVDILQVVREIALDTHRYRIGTTAVQRIRDAQVLTVSVLTTEGDRITREHRAMRVSDVLQVGDKGTGEQREPAGRQVEGIREAATYEDIVRTSRVSIATTGSLSDRIEKLSEQPIGPHLTGKLDAIQQGVEKAMRQENFAQAIEAIVALIRGEDEAPTAEVKRAYSVAIRRCLITDTLRRLVPYLVDELYTEDMIRLMRRAGTEGTRILMQQLVAAHTFAERKAYLKALRQIEEGTDVIASMLRHHEWFVVRNAADLVAELKITEAVPLLGAATSHEDPRVRLSVAMALVRMGSSEAARYLRGPLRDPDREVRLAVAKEIKDKSMAPLAMILVSAVESELDPEVLVEYCRALGRIGTPEAVSALIDVAQSSGEKRLIGKKAPDRRRPAIEGLGLSGSDAARAALTELSQDRDKDLRDAARAALAAIAAPPA